MSHHTGDEHQHGKHLAALGKAKEIAGAVLHSDELVEEGQLEEAEAAEQTQHEDGVDRTEPAAPPS